MRSLKVTQVIQQSLAAELRPHAPRLQSDDRKEMAWMEIVQVVGVGLQLVMVGPNTQRASEWYSGAWVMVRAFFVRTRESNPTVM